MLRVRTWGAGVKNFSLGICNSVPSTARSSFRLFLMIMLTLFNIMNIDKTEMTKHRLLRTGHASNKQN